MVTTNALWAPVVTEAPPYVPPMHSLMGTAGVDFSPPDRWEGGVEFETEACHAGQAYPGFVCDPCVKPHKVEMPPAGNVQAVPFQIVTTHYCKAGGLSPQERIRRVENRLAAVESKVLEWELWTGSQSNGAHCLSVHPSGATPDGRPALTPRDLQVVLNPGMPELTDVAGLNAVPPVDVASALALAAQYLANRGPGGRGMIHMTPFLAELAVFGGLLIEDTYEGRPVLRTRGRGDLIVIGAGYPGTGPGGHVPPPGTQWIHVTTMVQVWMGPVSVIPDPSEPVSHAMRTRTNDMTYIAERSALAFWDQCVHGSLLVSYTAPWLTGGAGE